MNKILGQDKMDKLYIFFVRGVFVHYLSNVLTVVDQREYDQTDLGRVESPDCILNRRGSGWIV